MRKLKNSIGKLGVRMIRFLARKLHLSLLDIGLSEAGYTKSHSLEASGELSFLRDYLHQCINTSNPVILDVGSNVGEYAKLIRKYYPSANLHCFEPNPKAFDQLVKNLPAEKNLINAGLSKAPGSMQLYFQHDQETSVQASLDQHILKEIAGAGNLRSVLVEIKTIDQYCRQQKLEKIDFLKIDTEGFELEVLEGAIDLLAEGKIKCIQFEFNEVNIVKRRFIKDFYDRLPHFEFFRLDQNRVIPMKDWSPNHEVFRFQNIIAVRKNG